MSPSEIFRHLDSASARRDQAGRELYQLLIALAPRSMRGGSAVEREDALHTACLSLLSRGRARRLPPDRDDEGVRAYCITTLHNSLRQIWRESGRFVLSDQMDSSVDEAACTTASAEAAPDHSIAEPRAAEKWLAEFDSVFDAWLAGAPAARRVELRGDWTLLKDRYLGRRTMAELVEVAMQGRVLPADADLAVERVRARNVIYTRNRRIRDDLAVHVTHLQRTGQLPKEQADRLFRGFRALVLCQRSTARGVLPEQQRRRSRSTREEP